jgi:hypothetical protein
MFPKKPKTIEELKMMMFPDEKWDDIVCPYGDSLTISQIISHVFTEINSQNETECYMSIESLEKYITDKERKILSSIEKSNGLWSKEYYEMEKK